MNPAYTRFWGETKSIKIIVPRPTEIQLKHGQKTSSLPMWTLKQRITQEMTTLSLVIYRNKF